MKLKLNFTICLCLTSLKAFSQDFIEPPTVLLSGGDFYMGSDRGALDERPVRKVNVPTFQMAKYEVTYKEFELFAKATKFKMENNCYQHVLGGPLRKQRGSWNNNIYQFGDFYPVVCVSLDAAKQYAIWLSKISGKQYRLPTEAEWEYALRAGTSSRYHFGEGKDKTRACEYGNVSDWYAAEMSAKLFEGASVAEVEQCNDNEATLSIVGLYKPNQFGVYDLVGNAQEYLQDCYKDSYENAPIDGSAVTVENCEQIVVRGGSWHWYPYHSSQRYALPTGTVGALEGIRLVLDTDGKSLPPQLGTPNFVKDLELAQKQAKQRHLESTNFPLPPQNLEVIHNSNKGVELRWRSNTEPFITGYKVYRQDPLSNNVVPLSKTLNVNHFTDQNPLPYNARYFVVALNQELESYKSNYVDSAFKTLHSIPNIIQAEAYQDADSLDIRFSNSEPEGDNIIVGIDDGAATYSLNPEVKGDYLINARVFHSGAPQEVEFWIGDRLIGETKLQGSVGWKTIGDILVNFDRQPQNLRIQGENQSFAVNWLDISLSKEN